MITAILGGIAAKLAGLGLAAKVDTGIAAATIATAGVATVAPVINPGAPAGIEVQVPSVPAAEADLGLSVAADAPSGQADAGAQVGLETARQTPAAAKVPTSVPATNRPAAGAAQSGLDVARQTPAADRLPAVVPGPPSGVPAVTPPVSLASAVLIDQGQANRLVGSTSGRGCQLRLCGQRGRRCSPSCSPGSGRGGAG